MTINVLLVVVLAKIQQDHTIAPVSLDITGMVLNALVC